MQNERNVAAAEKKPLQFEVGQFYRVQTSIWSRNVIPALCVKKSKMRVHFEYLARESDGKIVKYVTWRTLYSTTDGEEYALSNEKYSTLATVRPSHIAQKPPTWDSVPSTFKGAKQRKRKEG